MKHKSVFLMFTMALTASVFMNCSGHKHEESAEEKTTEATSEDASTEVAAPQFQVDAQFQQQLAGVFESYVALKDAFILSDPSKVKTNAETTKAAVNKVDMKLLSGAAHNDWMSYLTPIENSLKEIQASTDIETQRKSFSALSDNLYKSIKAFGLGGKEAFYEFCPMAFNNEGAYWLSDQSQIRNPYFGDKMLTCGSVKEKLK